MRRGRALGASWALGALWALGASAALALALGWAGGTARAEGPAPRLGQALVLMAAGDSCPDAVVGAGLLRVLRRSQGGAVDGARAAAAVARARASHALLRARQLYLRTNFAGCVALLSIIEQELGRHIADTSEARGQQAHRLLADVNLWLGVCQWSAGDPHTAAASFLRSAQLPSSPLPDQGLLPPAVVRAYRRAVRAPRQEVGCKLHLPLSADGLLVDGKGPMLREGVVQVTAGTHYLVLGGCDATGAACRELHQRIGGSGRRAMRLEARPLNCSIALPSQREPLPPVRCISHREAADRTFIAAALQEARGSLAVVASLRADRFALRLLPQGGREFSRQLSGRLGASEQRAPTIERSAALLVAVDVPSSRPGAGGGPGGDDAAWYRRWWIWAAVGAAAAVVTTTAVVLGGRSSGVRVVFGR